MNPAEGVASEGYYLADAGKEYVVSLNTAAPFALTVQEIRGSLKAEWFQPFTGQRPAAGTINNETAQLSSPEEWDNGPSFCPK